MINILFCGNDKVFDGVITCALSVLKRNTVKNEIFNFYVLTMNLSRLNPNFTSIDDKKIEFLDKVIKDYNPSNTITKIDITDLYEEHLGQSINNTTSYSPYCMLRLFSDLIPELPNKILYLDIDILCNKDIHELYDLDIENYEYATARDHYGKFLIHPNYMNSGVLLLNLKKIKETKLLEKARKVSVTKKMIFPDQSAIRINTTKKKMLPQKFNDQKFLHPKRTVIRHFSKRLFWLPYPHVENIKQWNVTKVHTVFRYTQFDDILYEYIYLKNKFEKEY